MNAHISAQHGQIATGLNIIHAGCVLGDAHGIQEAGRWVSSIKFGHTFQVLLVNPGNGLDLIRGIHVDNLFKRLVVFSPLRNIVFGMPTVFYNDVHHAV